jgi:hypothetical protein
MAIGAISLSANDRGGGVEAGGLATGHFLVARSPMNSSWIRKTFLNSIAPSATGSSTRDALLAAS